MELDIKDCRMNRRGQEIVAYKGAPEGEEGDTGKQEEQTTDRTDLKGTKEVIERN